jgi:tyrosinase
VRFEVKKRVLIAERTTVSLARPFSKETQVAPQDFSALITGDRAREKVFVSIDYAQMPPANDFFVRVFLNLPTARPETSTDDPHYAGSFAFFGTADGGHAGKTDFLVNVTETLQRLTRSGEAAAGRPLSVQLVAVPATATAALLKPEAELVLEKVELIVSPVLVRSR